MSAQHRLDRATRKSLRYSHRDAAASAVMTGITDHYLHAFAIFLRATPNQIGLLASIPALIGALMQLLSAWLAHKEFPRHRFVAIGAVFQAFSLLMLPFLLLTDPQWSVAILIAMVVVYRAAGNLIAPVWQSLMRDLVPERRRGRFFARRNRTATAVAFIALVSGGLLLDIGGYFGLPAIGFVLLFVLAFIARMFSARFISLMHEPAKPPEPAIPADFSPNLSFRRFVLLNAGMQGTVAIAGPYFSVYMLRELQFNYSDYMLVLAVSVLMQFITLNAWGGIADRFGNQKVLKATAWFIPVLPALWLFSGSLWWLVLIQVLGGVVWAGFSLASGNYLYDLSGTKPLATMLAINAIVTAMAIFVGAMLGSLTADYIPLLLPVTLFGIDLANNPLLGVFALSAIMRLVVVILFLRGIAEFRRVADSSFRDVVFRLARFNSVTGVAFDVIGAVKRDKK